MAVRQATWFQNTVRPNATILLILAAVVVVLRLVPIPVTEGVNHYLPLHMLLETLAIIIASMIFVLGWYTQRGTRTLRMQVIACLFLAVATLDFSHMISYAGMPDFITPADPEKAINFWLLARLFAALALLAAICLPDRELIYRRSLLSTLLLALAGIHYVLLFRQEQLPETFDAVTGLTSFKIRAEYVLILLYSIAAAVLWKRALADRQPETLALGMASAIMALSELLFTFYASVTDAFNVVGHVYKILAYAYLHQALVVRGITAPFLEMRTLTGRLQATLDALPDMMFEMSDEGIIRAYHSRPGIPQLLTSPEVFLGQDFRKFIADVDAIHTIEQAMADVFNTGRTSGRVYSLTTQGKQYWYELTGSLVEESLDKHCLILVRDVTSKYEAEQELRIAATAFSSQEGVLITDAQQSILRVNEAFERTTGYSQQEVIGMKPSFLSSGKHDDAFFKAMWATIVEEGGWHGEIWNRRKNGEIFPQAVTISAVKDSSGITTHYVGDMIDMSRIRDAEAKINRLSLFDPLTGLPNRSNFQTHLEHTLQECNNNCEFGALLMIDVDNFKNINDTLGHLAGDQLLVKVAQRLESVLQDNQLAARYGGDEFMVVLPQLSQETGKAVDKVESVAQALLGALNGEYRIGHEVYYSSCSIGISLFNSKDVEFSELLKQVDIALSQAKISGQSGISFFDPAWQKEVNERASLNADMREGLKKKQFELYYQAQVDVAERIVGAEALVRWKHPLRGLLSPAEFIPFAEENGWILDLGNEVLRLGLEQLALWQTNPKLSHLSLSINLSSEQFFEENFIDIVESGIQSRHLDARYLVLEFTESILISNVEQAKSNIERLSRLGIRFSIDDFGTGYSSLSYLSNLPIDQLKIDQSFVRNIGITEQDTAIVSTIINMAKTLHMEVLAEGVETDAQRAFLMAQGCQLLQGFLYAHPMPVKDFESYCSSHAVAPE
ncbi:MAG: EAL domain-containing protein [Pseudomonadales bacterium]|nr:EAL domain-containing protein [Pseudomonadales bacterium]MCP5359079.1 EAL domain-containing protein [Pseudomonadales bacterium]